MRTVTGRKVRVQPTLFMVLAVVAGLTIPVRLARASHAPGATTGRTGAGSFGSGYTLAPALMGGGADQPDALPNASLTLPDPLGGAVATLDPQVESTYYISSLVFSPLLALNQHNQVAANAATSMTVSPDGKTYTFTLRRGMEYSDGKAVTAQDYAYAIKRACDPAVDGQFSNVLFVVVGCRAWRTADTAALPVARLHALAAAVDDAIKAVDTYTLRIQLLHPAGYFPYVMTTWITYPSRADLVKAGGPNWWKNPAYYIGNGPFKVVSWTPQKQWVLARNDHYFRGKPGIATWIYRDVPSSETALLAYKEGQLDQTYLTANLVPIVQHDRRLEAQFSLLDGAGTRYLAFNSAVPPFNNLKVRQAFAYALNRRQLINQLGGSVLSPAGTFLYPGIAGYQDRVQQTYNPVKARQLLAQAGYPDGQGFPKVPIPLANDSLPLTEYFAQLFKQVLGVTIVPVSMDDAQFQSLLANRSPNLKLYFTGWNQDYPHPQDWLTLGFGNNSAFAPLGWNDVHFNALVNKADALPITEATPLYQEADAYLTEQAPAAFLFHTKWPQLIAPSVKGYDPHPVAGYDFFDEQPEKLYRTK